MTEPAGLAALLADLCACGHPLQYHHSETGTCMGALRLTLGLRGPVTMTNECDCDHPRPQEAPIDTTQ